jgi:hypothetical protein
MSNAYDGITPFRKEKPNSTDYPAYGYLSLSPESSAGGKQSSIYDFLGSYGLAEGDRSVFAGYGQYLSSEGTTAKAPPPPPVTPPSPPQAKTSPSSSAPTAAPQPVSAADIAWRLGGFVQRAIDSLAAPIRTNVWGQPTPEMQKAASVARDYLCTMAHAFHSAGFAEELSKRASNARSSSLPTKRFAGLLVQTALGAWPIHRSRMGLRVAMPVKEGQPSWDSLQNHLLTFFLGSSADAVAVRATIRRLCDGVILKLLAQSHSDVASNRDGLTTVQSTVDSVRHPDLKSLPSTARPSKPTVVKKKSIPRHKAEILVRNWLKKNGQKDPDRVTARAVSRATKVSLGQIPTLMAWREFQDRRMQRKKQAGSEPRTIPLHDAMLDAMPDGMAENPRDIAIRNEDESVWEAILQKASPDERAHLMNLNEDDRQELIELYRQQCRDA